MIVRGFGRFGRPGLLGTMARTAVIAGTATAVSGGVMRHQQAREEQREEAAAYEQQQTQEQVTPPSPPAAGGGSDLIGALNELDDLKDRGVLTEAEFETQKARLLAR